MSLQDQPQSILRIILEYIPDPETLCNLDCTCRELHALVQEDQLWKPRIEQRWTVSGNSNSRRISHRRNGTSRTIGSSSSPVTISALEEYKRRHMIDKGMIQCISRLKTTTEHLPMLYAFTHVMAAGPEAMDICFKLWKNMKSSDARMFARGLLRMLQCGVVCSDMIDVLSDGDHDNNDDENNIEQQQQSSSNNNNHNLSPGERLEKACILTTCMFREFDDETHLKDTTADRVKAKLHEIAEEIRRGFPTENNTAFRTTKAKLKRVHEVFFDHPDYGFAPNVSDYYDYRNSLLDVALERRKAIPMTLVLLYKFICQRVGIVAEVIGLPGHIVAHVPDLNVYVDVFNGGRHLTSVDCAAIVTNFGFPMQASYLNPLPAELIVQRTLNNLENCLVRHPTVSEQLGPCRRAAVTALRAIASNPRDEQLEECRHLLVLTWVTEACVGTNISVW